MDGTYAHRGPCSSVSWFKTGSDQAFVTEKVSSFLSDSGHASSDEASTTSGVGAATPRDAAKPSGRRNPNSSERNEQDVQLYAGETEHLSSQPHRQ